MKRFAGRRDVIGETVSLSGEPYTIVGVLPRSFAFAPRANVQFWVPLLDKNDVSSEEAATTSMGLAGCAMESPCRQPPPT